MPLNGTTDTGRKGRIAVTPRSLSGGGHPALRLLEDAGYDLVFPAPGDVPTEDQIRSSLIGCVGYLAGTEPLSGALLEELPQLRAISRNGVGVDSIDQEAAARLGISVLTAPGANSQGVAELTIALILAGCRNIPWHDAQLKSGNWERRPGREISGQVAGCHRLRPDWSPGGLPGFGTGDESAGVRRIPPGLLRSVSRFFLGAIGDCPVIKPDRIASYAAGRPPRPRRRGDRTAPGWRHRYQYCPGVAHRRHSNAASPGLRTGRHPRHRRI